MQGPFVTTDHGISWGENVVPLLCLLALITGLLLLLRDWWRDNRAGGL